MMQVGTARTVRAIGTERQREMALRIARGIWKRVPPHVPLADLEQVALAELWEALERKAEQASMAYLIICIRGRVKDELRRHDWLPRRARHDGRNLHVIHSADLAERFEENLPSPAPSPDDAIDAKQLLAEAWKAPLPARERRVLQAHYERGHRFSDIAAELGVSEPRVSQLHGRAIGIVRAWLTGKFDDESPGWAHVPLHLRESIMEKHAAHPIDQTPDPAPGGAPSEPPPPDTFLGRVRRGRLGCAPAPEPDRPVPRGAGAPALDGEASPELRHPAPAEAAPPGEVVEEPAEPAAVPSVLPEGGIDLRAELTRYRDWLIGQALIVTAGHQRKAADLLGLREDVFSRVLKRERGLIGLHFSSAKAPPAPAPSPAMKPQRRRAEHGGSLTEVMSRLPRAQIAKWHEEGKTTGYMATQLKRQISAGYSLLELAVRRTVASLARHDQQSGAPTLGAR